MKRNMTRGNAIGNTFGNIDAPFETKQVSCKDTVGEAIRLA